MMREAAREGLPADVVAKVSALSAGHEEEVNVGSRSMMATFVAERAAVHMHITRQSASLIRALFMDV